MIYSSLRKPLTVSAVLILTTILFALGPTNVTAVPTTYTYIGNLFDTFQNENPPEGSYTASDSVNGDFTLDTALGPNRDLAPIPLAGTSFSFNDGRNTIADTTPGVNIEKFDISTGPTGDIDFFFVALAAPEDPGLALLPILFSIQTRNTNPEAFDFGNITVLGDPVTFDQGGNTGNPGSWTTQTPGPPPIPEPSTMLLLGSGLAGLGFFRRRKKAA